MLHALDTPHGIECIVVVVVVLQKKANMFRILFGNVHVDI